MVYKLNDDFGYLVIKNYGGVFKYYVHIVWDCDHRHISVGGRIKHYAIILALIK